MKDIASVSGLLSRNLEELKGRKDPEAMKAVAREMESMFAFEMIKVMRETSGMTDKGSLGAGTYMSMFDLEVSKLFAQRGLGLQETLAAGLKHLSEKKASVPQLSPLPSPPASLEDEVRKLLPDLKHPAVSSAYGMRQDPFTGRAKFHHGVDIPAAEGTPIHATRSGTVSFSGEQRGYGNVVEIDHGDGLVSRYAHTRSNSVQAGEQVQAGSIIARVGSTGRSTGPHVHFEVRSRGESVDPAALPARQD